MDRNLQQDFHRSRIFTNLKWVFKIHFKKSVNFQFFIVFTSVQCIHLWQVTENCAMYQHETREIVDHPRSGVRCIW